MAADIVTLPMDAFFQPLFYTFEGLLDDINDRLQNPNKLFGTWGSKKGPAATECIKGLGHLKAALELRPALYKAARWNALQFKSQMDMKEAFDSAAKKLMDTFAGIDVITPTQVGDVPSIQVYFVRNVLAFLDVMERFPACQRAGAERVANFFTNNAAQIADYKRDLQKYLAEYNERYGGLARKFVETRGQVREAVAAAVAPMIPMAGPLPPGTTTNVGALRGALSRAVATGAEMTAKNAAAAAARYGRKIESGSQAGGRRRHRTYRHKAKRTTRRRKSRRHH